MNEKDKVKDGSVKFFGKNLIETKLKVNQESDQKLTLHFQFNFNGGWQFLHDCCQCNSTISVSEDFGSNTKNFNVITNINSSTYNTNLVKYIASLFTNLQIVEIDGVIYLNRKDFEYTFDFQKKSSINLTYYKCDNCDSLYLGLIFIGYPLSPDKGLPNGRLGQIKFLEIVKMNSEDKIVQMLFRKK